MSKVTVAGSSVVLTSSMKLNDIKKLNRYAPKALQVIDAETKDVEFAVSVSYCEESLSVYGISFAAANAAGFAQITLAEVVSASATNEEKIKGTTDKLGKALFNLGIVEANAEKALADIDAMLGKVTESISVAE